MAEKRTDAIDITDMTNLSQKSARDLSFERSIPSATQDIPGDDYTPDWDKWFGYYKTIPELQAVIDKYAMWVGGKGYEADGKVKKRLDKITGMGKDTFDDIMWNLVRMGKICGDSFAEIIRNKRGELINLKPINPGSIVIKSNARGIITKYEQVVIGGSKQGEKKTISFTPKEMFHLPWNRLGDEIHGISTIQKMERIILMRDESMEDMKIVFHRYVKPLLITSADTDEPSEIASIKKKMDNAVNLGENMVVPAGTVTVERMSIPQYSTLDPLPWLRLLEQFFIMSEGVPEVILGFGRETTEASAKILYLAFQQTIEHGQRFLERQIKTQLALEVEFNFPADLQPDVKEDQAKARKMSTLPDKGVKL